MANPVGLSLGKCGSVRSSGRAPAVRPRLGARDPATAIVSVGVTGQVLDFYSSTFTSMP